ncbi:hypothetical protein SH449x_004545 [Pirellulaceae bacterium SH449]
MRKPNNPPIESAGFVGGAGDRFFSEKPNDPQGNPAGFACSVNGEFRSRLRLHRQDRECTWLAQVKLTFLATPTGSAARHRECTWLDQVIVTFPARFAGTGLPCGSLTIRRSSRRDSWAGRAIAFLARNLTIRRAILRDSLVPSTGNSGAACGYTDRIENAPGLTR